MKPKLTPRQRMFVEAYAGNATQAARQAGYTGNSATLAVTGCQLLRLAKVREAITAREAAQMERFTLTRDERLEALSVIAIDTDGEKTRDRLKAIDQLCRAFGDYTEKLEVKVSGSFSELLKKARQRAQRG